MNVQSSVLIELAYLAASALFILGLHNLNSPETARRGNALSSLGMLIAVVATLFHRDVVSFGAVLSGIVVGSAAGATGALRVKMTGMPQMVGLLNGFGGGASALVAAAEFWRISQSAQTAPPDTILTIMAGLLVGGVTLTGSLLAFAKLQGLVTGSPILFPFQRTVSTLLLFLFLAGSAYLTLSGVADLTVVSTLIAVALVLGVLFVAPVGGADMPVVISLLNSLSGLAASVVGFLLNNNLLIVAGALVGAAGAILTHIMSKAMNRSLANVLYGAVGAAAGGESGTAREKTVRSIDAEQAAMMLAYAGSVVIVPGYGMAVARAQYAVRELADQLEKRGVDVKYAIHPVAGRMPGHMNVLLAEAEVPYEKLYDLEDINPEFERTDVAVVIGASDVVNPAARYAAGSPIYGMPILNVDKARHIIVIKRGMSPGFSGIDNDLFYHERTLMLFGDAREAVTGLVNEVKKL
jgi:NAD(P) transhydrogenase subunit beta